jgi:CRISPR-associated endonuclease/helicase Cas3
LTQPCRIQSHFDPRRTLEQHVAEILAATDALLQQHGSAPWRALGGDPLTVDLARLHDLGKGSRSFQAYIADPVAWKGDPLRKAHTLLSLVLATTWSQNVGLDPVGIIARALAVKGHHGQQPCDSASLYGTLSESEPRDALCAELPTVDPTRLAAETGISLLTMAAPLAPLAPLAMLRGAMSTLRHALDGWRALAPDEMVRARFIARAAYSVLLEADKAFLAIDASQIQSYLHRPRPAISVATVDQWCTSLPQTPMDKLRDQAHSEAIKGFARCADQPLLRLTLPTGAGKTLIAARWAIEERERRGDCTRRDTPTVILALPMLSIVDQTEQVWRRMLGASVDDDGDMLLPFHSLSDRVYDSELSQGTADFFIDTWRSEVVVTTFDQLLLALYSDRAKHAMRFHRLLNACIVIDEIQCVPPALWTAFSIGLRALTDLGRTRVLAMSATPSPCLDGATEVLDDPGALYQGLSRYELGLEHETLLDFESFISTVIERCQAHRARAEGTLVTVNVRATAQETWERLDAVGLDPVLLSGDMTPAHRLLVIDRLKDNPARVVVSTQCVEAGVDLDMHHVIRDLAPLDALVQIAGRCNRHAHRTEPGTVTVMHLRGPDNRDDADIIYDPILLQCTKEVLQNRSVVAERDVLGLCRDWFGRVEERKYRGGDHFTKWRRIEKELDVRSLLRGEERDQRQVVVTEQDPSLKPALLAAIRISDRWKRRSTLRALSAALARCTVSVAPKVFEALNKQPIGPLAVWTELLPGQYHPVRGIDSRRRG